MTGQQVRVTKTFATKKEADAWVRQQKQKFDTGAWSARSNRTFNEVADHWLTVREADPDTRANTVRADRESLTYARRAFGETPVQKITPLVLVSWSITMTRSDGEPLGHDTKRRAVGTLKLVMRHAVAMKWIGSDPAASLTPPRQKAKQVGTPVLDADADADGQDRDRDGEADPVAASGIWTPAQMDQFAGHIADHRLAGCGC